MELLKSMAQINLLHVPYKGGGPAFPDFLAGRVQATFTTYGSTSEHVRAGRLRALAVSSAKRTRVMPDLPTVAEAGVPGYESGVWYGLVAPRGVSRQIIQKLNAEAIATMNAADVHERLSAIGMEVIGSTAEKFDAYIRSEIPKWAQVVNRSGAKID
jgi:tripartite-type tricarboxylate transporter receptor subunit TctC